MEVGLVRGGIEMNRNARRIAKFRAKVFPFRLKLGNDRGTRAEPNVQVLQGIVINEVELNVFVAPAFS
ncbi:MAG TPA: hypothetical protein VF146_01630, partial [Bryobacteraceae bacterium]